MARFGVALALTLLFFSRPGHAADGTGGTDAREHRWNPPITGAFLGVVGNVRRGGFVVARVSERSAAHRAGLRRGDVVLEVGGRGPFSTFANFAAVINALDPGVPAVAVVSRSGKRHVLSVVLDHSALRDLYTLVQRIRDSRFVGRVDGVDAALATILDVDLQRLRDVSRWSPAYEILNDAGGRLGLSHVAVVPPWTYENVFGQSANAAGTYRLGIVLVATAAPGGRPSFFVLQVINGAPADRAGLRRGDEVLRINDLTAEESPRRILAGYESIHPYFIIQVDPQERVELTIRRRRGGVPERISLTANVRVSEFRATRESLRVVERSGRLLGYLHTWNFLSRGLADLVNAALSTGESGGVEGWILDLRGRGGRVDVLRELIAILEKDRRPRVLLIDRDTRSAKEILAHRLRGAPFTRLVGERTAGAVLPAGFRPLSRGAALMFPVDPRIVRGLTGGTVLEGVGVEPDVEVAAPVPYSAGADPILERGTEMLLELLRKVPRRRRF